MLKYGDIDSSLKALAEPTRRAIVERLSEGPMSVSDLARPFDMSLAAIVQHLNVLEDAGFVASQKIGRVRTCRLEAGGFDRLNEWVAERRSRMERKLDLLGQLLAAQDEAAAATKTTRQKTSVKKELKK
jgi:DNA-binding transcriptional ArsR family regulator